MPRNKPLKTNRVRASKTDIEKAVNKVLKENISLRVAAEMYNISKSKLARHIGEAKKNGEQNGVFVIPPRKIPNQVFTSQQETDLETFLIKASELLPGLTPTDIRKLAYEFGKQLNLPLPSKWEAEKEAGKEWLYGFMKRHNKLSIRAPGATSGLLNRRLHQTSPGTLELPTPTDMVPTRAQDLSTPLNLNEFQEHHVSFKNSKIPRNKPLKTNRVRASQTVIENAVNKVLKENVSLRAAAEMYNISKSKLARHIGEAKKNGEQNGIFIITPRKIPNQVFTIQQETDLEAYLINASELLLGLTTTDIRKLAYEFGKDLCLQLPSKWESEKEAGKDWLYGFMKRHNKLSMLISVSNLSRKLQQTSHSTIEFPTPTDFTPLNLSLTDNIIETNSTIQSHQSCNSTEELAGNSQFN